MNSSYRKGYNFERKVKADLEKKGLFVLRQGKSAFPDLVAIPLSSNKLCRTPLLVECKYGKHPNLSRAEKEQFVELRKLNARCYLARGKPRQPIEYEAL
jgi:Holliday junction resolvase